MQMEKDSAKNKIKEYFNPLFEQWDMCLMKIKGGKRVPDVTQGQEKLVNQLYEITRSDSFEGKIVELRKKYHIPENGYPGYEDLDRVYDEEHKTLITLAIPYGFVCPQEWLNEKKEGMTDVDKDISGLCRECRVPSDASSGWFLIFKNYLFYNVVEPSVTFDLCEVVDCDSRDANFPVGILVSPCASKADILSYIDKNYSILVKPLQIKHKKENEIIGTIRRKNAALQERNDFIYANRYLPRKVIAQKVNKKFPDEELDYSGIGKIIAGEKTKRKNGE